MRARLILLLMVVISTISTAVQAQNPAFAWVMVDGKWGLMDEKGQFVFKPQLELSRRPEFSDEDSCAVVWVGDSVGLLHRRGHWVLPVMYDHIYYPKAKSFRMVEKKKKWGLFGPKAEWIMEPRYDAVICFDEETDSYRDNGMEYQMNMFGWWYSSKAEEAGFPDCILALEGEKMGVFDSLGNPMIPMNYTLIKPMGAKLFWVLEGGKIVDDSLKMKESKRNYYDQSDFKFKKREGGKWYVHEMNGQKRPDLSFDEIDYMANQDVGITYFVKSKDKWGVVDSLGKLIVVPAYDSIEFVWHDKVVAAKNKLWGLASLSGEMLAPFQYDTVLRVNENIYAFKLKGKFTLYSLLTGKKIEEGITKTTKESYSYGNYYKPAYIMKKDKLFGVISDSGVVVLPFEYKEIFEIGYSSDNKKYKVEKDDKMALFDNKGKMLIPFTYDYLGFGRNIFSDIMVGCNGCMDTEDYFKKTSKKISSQGKVGGQWTVFSYKSNKILLKGFACDYVMRVDSPYVIYSRDCKFGARDFAGNEMLPPVYDQIYRNENRYIVEQSGRQGLTDSTFRFVIELDKQNIEKVGADPAYFLVRGKEKQGVTDDKGRWLLPKENDLLQKISAYRLQNGKDDTTIVYYLQEKEGQLGLLDVNFKPVLPLGFQEIHTFKAGEKKGYYGSFSPIGEKWLIQVKKDDKFAVYSIKTGAYESPFVEQLLDYSPGYTLVTDKGQTGLINLAGKITPFAATEISQSNKKAAALRNSSFCLLTDDGKKPLPADYVSVTSFSYRLSLVKKGDKYGIIDETGEIVVPFEYSEFEVAGPVCFLKKDGKWGIIDNEAKFTASPNLEFDQIYFHDANINKAEQKFYFKVRRGKSYGVIDQFGNTIIPVQYETLNIKSYRVRENEKLDSRTFYHFAWGYGNNDYYGDDEERKYLYHAVVSKNSRVGLYDLKGNLILPVEYDEITSENDVFILKKDDHFGLYQVTTQRLIKPEHDDLSEDISNGLVAANVGRIKGNCEYKPGKWGYLDTLNQWAIPAKLDVDFAGEFHNGYAYVKKDKKVGIINTKGKMVVEPAYNDITPTGLGAFLVENQNEKYGLLDLQNKLVLDTIYDNISSFWLHPGQTGGKGKGKSKKKSPTAESAGIEQFFIVRQGNFERIFTTDGKPLLADSFNVIYNIAGANVLLVNKGATREEYNDNEFTGGKWGFISIKGQTLYPIELDEAYVGNINSAKESGLLKTYHYISHLIKPEALLDTLESYTREMYVVGKDDRWGYVNKEGKLALPIKYIQAYWFNDENEAFILDKEKNDTVTKIINFKGKVLAQFLGEITRTFDENRYLAQYKGKFGLVTREGKQILPFKYEGIKMEDSKKFPYEIQTKDGTGMVNANGEVVLEPKYDAVFVWQEQMFIVKKKERWGMINPKGEVVFPFDYTSIRANSVYSAIGAQAGVRLARPDGQLLFDQIFEQAELVGEAKKNRNSYYED